MSAIIPALALLAGCSGSTKAEDVQATESPTQAALVAAPAITAASAPAMTATPTLSLAGSGLALTPGTGRKPQALPFGTDEKRTIATISSVLGEPSTQGTNQDCPVGPVQFATWSKGLSVNFHDGKFVGWDGAVDIKTSRGIGFGSTRAELVKAYKPTFEESTLGTEFFADDISGIMESDAADATISDLWAGLSCVAR